MQATREIGLAVMATTLSLVIIFLPIAFMSGYARKYVNSFGWTMAMAILVSLLVAFTLTPMMSSRLLKVGAKEKEQHAHGFMHSIEEFYLKLLRWSLAHRRIILVIYVVTFASTFGLYHLVGRDWIPADDQAELMSSFTLPEGTSLEKTTQMAQDMAGRVVALPEVAFVQTLTHGPTNHAHLFIGLVPRTERKRTHEQMAGVVRGILGSYRNITYNVRLPSVLGGETYFPIAAVIRGPEIDRLAEISKKIANRMRQFPELVDVNPSLNLNTPELQVKLDRQRAADIGVRMTDVSDSVRLFYSGEDEITRFKEGSEQYPVVMQLLPEQRDNPDVLASMMVPSTKLGQVRLENVASIVRGAGPATLWRYNREFQVSVFANVAPGHPLDIGAAHTEQAIKEVGLPPGYSYPFFRPGKSAGRNDLESFAGDAAGFHLYVYGAGRAVRKFFVSIHHHADAAAQHSVRAFLFVDHRARAQPVERARNVSATRHREEKRHSAGGLHQSPAQRRQIRARSHPGSESRAPAPDSDDHAFHRRRVDTGGHRHGRGLGAARLHRSDHHRRANTVLAADAAHSTSGVLLPGRTRDSSVARVRAPTIGPGAYSCFQLVR